MALTVSPKNFNLCTWGNKRVCFASVTGDGVVTTISVPLGKIEAAFVGNQTETAGYNPPLSWSGNVLTYGAAPSSTKIHTLFVVGSD